MKTALAKQVVKAWLKVSQKANKVRDWRLTISQISLGNNIEKQLAPPKRTAQ